jgi:HEAT repeat protein
MSAQRDEIVRALVGEFPKLPPARQALVLLLLGDLQDRRALPLVFSAVQSAPTDVRAAAVRSLRQLGDVSVVPLLLKVAAADPEETIALEAQNVLRSLPGREMDATLLSALQQSDGRTQLVLIGIVGYRRIEVAWPILLKFADDEQPQVRLAALAALGETATLDGLPTLTSRIIGSQSAEEGAAVREALKVACVRMPDRDACAEKLAASLAEAPPAAKTMLLDLLGSVGGSTALAAVARSARDPDASVQDAATRVLGEWLSADAAPELLDLAQTLDDDRLKTRALRGYIRVIRQLGLPAEERISMCREALRVAKRDEERKLLMEVLGRNPSVEGLSLVVPYLGQPRLRNEASAAIIAIAEKIAPADRNAAEDALRRVLQSGASDEAKARAQTMLNQGGQ